MTEGPSIKHSKLNTLWCDLFHGGGQIKRDDDGRINWQCNKCLRWSDPVDTMTERLITDAAIKAKLKEKSNG